MKKVNSLTDINSLFLLDKVGCECFHRSASTRMSWSTACLAETGNCKKRSATPGVLKMANIKFEQMMDY